MISKVGKTILLYQQNALKKGVNGYNSLLHEHLFKTSMVSAALIFAAGDYIT